MPNDFDDIRLPEDIERGAVGGPNFNTTVISLVSGKERRNQEWAIPRTTVNVGYGIKRREDLEEIYAFFHARGGRARGFRFRNWLDFEVRLSPVGIIDGAPEQRQLVRYYDDPINPYVKVISHPIASTLNVYVNSVITTNYILEPNGVISFPNDPGEDVRASYDFDLPVRFDTDQLNVNLNTYKEGVIPSIPIIELLL